MVVTNLVKENWGHGGGEDTKKKGDQGGAPALGGKEMEGVGSLETWRC